MPIAIAPINLSSWNYSTWYASQAADKDTQDLAKPAFPNSSN